jgi:hypothetical protein
MPKDWADRIIMFSVIGLVVWGLIGLPATEWALSPRSQPAHSPSRQQAADASHEEGAWLTKDAAGFFTFGLVVVGGIQVALFLWQLWLIRESLNDAKTAADAAKEAADVAKESLNLSRENAQTELRAYLVVATAGIYNVADPPNPVPQGQQPPPGARTLPDRGPIALVTIVNAGKTPANDVIHWGAVYLREYPLVEPLPGRIGVDHLTRFNIGPGVTTTKNMVIRAPLTDEEVAALRDLSKAIYVYGEITYRDAFGHPRHTNYRYRHNGLTGIIGITSELTGSDEGNSSN